MSGGRQRHYAVLVGDLPEQCAALNRTNINLQLMTIEAAMTRRKEAIYQAAMLDPHLQSELSIDDIVSLCDDLIAARQGWPRNISKTSKQSKGGLNFSVRG